jgi:hypothetical protein
VILTKCFGKKGAWSFIPAVLISLSRIFLCVHYPTDVLAGVTEGIMLGMAVTYVGMKILNKLEKFYFEKKNKKASENIERVNSDSNNEKEVSSVEKTIVEDEVAENLSVPEKVEVIEGSHGGHPIVSDHADYPLQDRLEDHLELQEEQEKIDDMIESLVEENVTNKDNKK